MAVLFRAITPLAWQGRRVPDDALAGADGWLNSDTLTIPSLRGRVALLDFFDYTCVNCLRTLPYLTEWWRRYAGRGLTVVGIHAPEFDIGAIPANVERGLARLGVTYPVALDNHFRIWRTFRNNVWPRHFLLDREGVVVEDHAGEGGYRETEERIQHLLGVTDIPPMDYVRPQDRPQAGCLPQTAETYLGYQRGELPQGYRRNAVMEYRDTEEHRLHGVYLQGPWQAGPQSIRHARRTDSPDEDYLELVYLAQEVNLVIDGSPDRPYDVLVTLDGLPLPPEFRTPGITERDGRTWVRVDEPRMYRLVFGPYGQHTLHLASDSDRFRAYAFTFGAWDV